MKVIVHWYDGNDNFANLVKFENPIYGPSGIEEHLRNLPKFHNLDMVNMVVALPYGTEDDMLQVHLDGMTLVAEVGTWTPEEQERGTQDSYVYVDEIDLEKELAELG